MEYRPDTKAKRRSDRALVSAYHEAELIKLLDHVRDGLAAYDAKTIDAFELDDIIHQYKRATVELWKFCSAPSSATAMAARAIEQARHGGGNVGLVAGRRPAKARPVAVPYGSRRPR